MTISFRRSLAALCLFGVSFGCVEAAVVVYLRTILEPVRRQFHPAVPAADIFPLLTLDQLGALRRLLATELTRETATILMVAAAGLFVSRRGGTWLAAFAIAFGVWDISFYGFLKIFLNWPESLMTWDLLFLLPVPWYGPVVTPMIVAATMILGGARYLWRPFAVSRVQFFGILAGASFQLVAFCSDWKNLMAGGMPNPFPWWLFAAGEAMIVAAFLIATRKTD